MGLKSCLFWKHFPDLVWGLIWNDTLKLLYNGKTRYIFSPGVPWQNTTEQKPQNNRNLSSHSTEGYKSKIKGCHHGLVSSPTVREHLFLVSLLVPGVLPAIFSVPWLVDALWKVLISVFMFTWHSSCVCVCLCVPISPFLLDEDPC